MKETLLQLVALQRLDERLATLKRRLETLPGELGEHQSRQSALEAAAEEVDEKRKAALARAQDLENDVRSRDTRIQKLEEQVRITRDAGAVKIAEHEIHELRSKNSDDEDEALKLLDRGEAMVKEHRDCVETVESGRSELKVFAQTVVADQAELQGEIDGLQAERKALAGAIPKQVLEVYERIAPARKGRPIALLRGDSCGGCGMVVPPNDRVKVMAMSTVARCRSCTRILVLQAIWSPETAGAETEGD